MPKPPQLRDWMTTVRATRLFLPFQKNGKIMRFSLPRAQPGIGSKVAMYHTQARARALEIRALPPYDKWRLLQAEKHLATASTQGHQFALSRLPFPIKVPKTLILLDVHWKGTGLSGRPSQPPNQRPSHLSKFNLTPSLSENEHACEKPPP